MNAARPFSAGYVLSSSFRILFRNFLPIGLLSLVLIALPSLLIQLLITRPMTTKFLAGESNFSTTAYFSTVIGQTVLLYLLIALMMAAVTGAAISALRGADVDIMPSVRKGLKSILSVFIAFFIAAIAMTLGFVLLVVPGVIIALMWSVLVPAIVNEKRGPFSALGRSRELTKGYRWQIFAIFIILFLISFIPGAALSAAMIGGGQITAQEIVEGFTTPIWYDVVSILISSLIYGLYAVTATVLYDELRRIKEGLGLDELATAFD